MEQDSSVKLKKLLKVTRPPTGATKWDNPHANIDQPPALRQCVQNNWQQQSLIHVLLEHSQATIVNKTNGTDKKCTKMHQLEGISQTCFRLTNQLPHKLCAAVQVVSIQQIQLAHMATH